MRKSYQNSALSNLEYAFFNFDSAVFRSWLTLPWDRKYLRDISTPEQCSKNFNVITSHSFSESVDNI